MRELTNLGNPVEGGVANAGSREESDLAGDVREELVTSGVELVRERLESLSLLHGQREHSSSVVGGSADDLEHVGRGVGELRARAAGVRQASSVEVLDAVENSRHDGVDGAEFAGAKLGSAGRGEDAGSEEGNGGRELHGDYGIRE